MRVSYSIVRLSYQVFRLSYRENRLSGFELIVYQVLRLSGFAFIVYQVLRLSGFAFIRFCVDPVLGFPFIRFCIYRCSCGCSSSHRHIIASRHVHDVMNFETGIIHPLNGCCTKTISSV